MILVVVDTNVIVSALRNRLGNEAGILTAIRDERIRPCMTDAMVAEYADVLRRPRLRFASSEIEDTLQALNHWGLRVRPVQPAQPSPDPDDTEFIACAVAARAAFLVTGNRRHFPEASYGTAAVVNARQLLDRIAAPN